MHSSFCKLPLPFIIAADKQPAQKENRLQNINVCICLGGQSSEVNIPLTIKYIIIVTENCFVNSSAPHSHLFPL